MRKSIWITGGILACFIILMLWFYYTAKDGFAEAENEAIEWALELTALIEVDHVEFFAGETNYTVVFGNNSEGEKLVVWVGDEIIHEEKASDGVSKSTIRQQVIERHGSVSFVRTTPGRLGELWVWEVFYKKQESDGMRHYYDYYKFTDGEWVDTYRLNLEE